ncbi:hypothetical protein SEPCBS119000_000550 [Sporothrix epigloea]|uniref:Uncharacterized protein n=1 Tax=Sporothrix epigloea TaxID=1892477 RepID=A0ABP0D5Q7_9PEZI
MTIATAPVQAKPMAAEPTPTTTSTVAQQPPSEPRPVAATLSPPATLRGGNLSLGCHCCHGSLSFYKSCC